EGIKDLTSQLKDRRNRYEEQSANRPVLERAAIALQNGLAETALNLLKSADPKDRQSSGKTLAVSLLLGTGRTDEGRHARTPEPRSNTPIDRREFGPHPLGLPAYEWFQVQLAAATGDYAGADRHLADCLDQMKTSQTLAAYLYALDFLPEGLAEKPIDAATA